MDQKDSKYLDESIKKKARPRKRKFYGNQYTAECSISFTSAMAKTMADIEDNKIPMNKEHGYCFLNFYKMFSIISIYVICREYKNNIEFQRLYPRGLGFKLILKCECGVKSIDSCPLINGAFEINRRIVFAM